MRGNVKRPASTIAPVGWFSRKHQTSEAHERAVDLYRSQHGPAARKFRVKVRRAESYGKETES